MKYCTSCGSELIADAKFCTSCGEPVKRLEGASAQNSSTTASAEETKEKVVAAVSNVKTTVQKSGYFNYFQETAKRPSSGVIAEGYNGWIHLTVLSFVTAFAFYGIVKGSINVMRGSSGLFYFGAGLVNNYAGDYISEIMSSVLLRVFIASLIIYLIFIVATFAMLKITSKNQPLTFTSVVNRFSGLLTPNIILLLGATVFTLLFASEITLTLLSMLLFFSIILCFLAYNYFIYTQTTFERLDRLYVLLVSNVTILLVLALLVVIQLYPIFRQLEGLLGNLF